VPEETAEQRLARLRALSDDNRNAWLSYLSKLADDDRSGSVSSDEGTVFRRRAFLGLTAARLPHVQSAAQLAKLIEGDPREVSEDLAAYVLIQAAADRDGMKGLPALSSALVEPSNKR
jgi:DNA-binding transcriptional ArsR family regulator